MRIMEPAQPVANTQLTQHQAHPCTRSALPLAGHSADGSAELSAQAAREGCSYPREGQGYLGFTSLLLSPPRLLQSFLCPLVCQVARTAGSWLAALGVSPGVSFSSRDRAGFQGWKPSAFKVWSQKYLDFLGSCKTHDLAGSRPAQNEEEETPLPLGAGAAVSAGALTAPALPWYQVSGVGLGD